MAHFLEQQTAIKSQIEGYHSTVAHNYGQLQHNYGWVAQNIGYLLQNQKRMEQRQQEQEQRQNQIAPGNDSEFLHLLHQQSKHFFDAMNYLVNKNQNQRNAANQNCGNVTNITNASFHGGAGISQTPVGTTTSPGGTTISTIPTGGKAAWSPSRRNCTIYGDTPPVDKKPPADDNGCWTPSGRHCCIYGDTPPAAKNPPADNTSPLSVEYEGTNLAPKPLDSDSPVDSTLFASQEHDAAPYVNPNPTVTHRQWVDYKRPPRTTTTVRAKNPPPPPVAVPYPGPTGTLPIPNFQQGYQHNVPLARTPGNVLRRQSMKSKKKQGQKEKDNHAILNLGIPDSMEKFHHNWHHHQLYRLKKSELTSKNSMILKKYERLYEIVRTRAGLSTVASGQSPFNGRMSKEERDRIKRDEFRACCEIEDDIKRAKRTRDGATSVSKLIEEYAGQQIESKNKRRKKRSRNEGI